MKKTVSLILAAAMLLSCAVCFASCGKKNGTFRVGICNYVDDASLNQIVDNIKSELADIGNDKGVTFDIIYDNCNADTNVLAQIVSTFKTRNVDLMIAVATPVAIAMQAATEDTDIPVVFAAVSDPVGTKLVDSLEKPGANITGTSDYLDTASVMKLILAQNPGAKKIGLLYDLGQDSSTTAIADAKAFLDGKGIQYVVKNGTNVDEIKLAAKALIAEGVDAVFTPTDNTVMTAELSIYESFAEAKIPHFGGADSFALNGAFLGYGVDYANLGRETAKTAADILLNGKKPADVPVKTFDNGTATVNTEICSALGLDYETVKAALSPFCTKVVPITTAESFS